MKYFQLEFFPIYGNYTYVYKLNCATYRLVSKPAVTHRSLSWTLKTTWYAFGGEG